MNYMIKAKILLFVSSLWFPAIGFCQEKTGELQLVDEQNTLPVADVHFIYGDTKGVSDKDGMIEVKFNPGWDLVLSHVEFGRKRFSPRQVEDALQKGMLEIEKSDPLMLQPVTIMAMRKGQATSELLSLSDYDRLSHDAGSYLSQDPAISVIRKSGNYGFDPVMRGFKYEQLNLIIDGTQTALAACPNRMDPPASQISLNQMEKVEILKGPHFFRYGPSLGGTINFVTSQPDFHASLDPLGRISTSYESNGNIFRSEGLIGIRNSNYVMNVNGSWSMGSDYIDGDGIIIPSAFNRGSFGSKMTFKLNDYQDLDVNLTRNLARDVVFAALPMDLREDNTWLVNAKHRIDFRDSRLTSLNTTGYYTRVRHRMDNLTKDLDPRMVNAATDATTVSYGGRTEATIRGGSSLAYLGIDLHMEEADGIRTREMLMGPMAGNVVKDNVWQHGRITRSGIFGEYRLRVAAFDYIISGRLEVNNNRIMDVSQDFSDIYDNTGSTQVNPSISAGVNGKLLNEVIIGVWLGRGLRSGSLTERYINFFPVGPDPYEMIGNPELDPETNNQFDFNITYKGKSTEIQLNTFVSLLQDYISSQIKEDLQPRLPSSPGVRQFINIDRAMMSGFEINWYQYLPANLVMRMGTAFTYGKDLVREEPLPEIAPLDFQVGLTGHFLRNRLRPEITFRSVVKQERIAESYGETVTPGFNLVDLKITYDISKVFHIAAGVRNLFNVAYYEHLNRTVRDISRRPIYAPGRNGIITLTLDLME